jgi:hypothetical protein
MMRHVGRLALTLTLLAFATSEGRAQEKQEQLPAEARRAEDAVKAALQKVGGQNAQLLYKAEPALKQVFPSQVFIVARFRQFPVAREIPAGLQASNVFAVPKKEETPLLLKTVKELETFFQKSAVSAENAATARDALAAWLTLSQELHQDGFFKFEVLEKEFAVETNEKTQAARGRAMVTQGGNGELTATLTYTGGKLTSVAETAQIRPGPRPICQATKLLDADLIVRRMAEQDLLIMGRAARGYLTEQRDRAGPELRDAIDRLWRKIEANGW